MQRAILVLLVFACCGLAFTGSQVAEISKQINDPRRGGIVATFERTWISDGIPVKITATQQTGETAAAFVARCRELYEAMLEEFPEDE